MADVEFYAPDPRLTTKLAYNASQLWAMIKAPFDACPENMSFDVNAHSCFTERQLRTLISRRAKSRGKVFRVTKHAHSGHTYYQITRLKGTEAVEEEEETEVKVSMNPDAWTTGPVLSPAEEMAKREQEWKIKTKENAEARKTNHKPWVMPNE